MQTSVDDLVLVDTNVLIESLFDGAPHHEAAAALLERAQSGDVDLCILPQVLAEFYSVVTDKRRVESAMSFDEAIGAINTFLAMPGVTELPVPVDLTSKWLDLARQRHRSQSGDEPKSKRRAQAHRAALKRHRIRFAIMSAMFRAAAVPQHGWFGLNFPTLTILTRLESSRRKSSDAAINWS